MTLIEKMSFGFIYLLFIASTNGQARDTAYECGAHGRFEYCIDGIPGCVIGCHCHPGYYFDTDSKVCEPNVKLTQEFRRQYIPEPTSAPVPITTSTVEEPVTKTDGIDEKIDEITNDTGDLGDWLYNQFFKTIENQVINNTKDENLQIRRSGSGPNMSVKSRRSHKPKKSKKKRKKNSRFKNKLLRITEDDSLFDSSSGSSSSDDSSSSSSSESESDSRLPRRPRNKNHGHKKILVVNKRPRPPLPSFVFLPNMETPFYPPIGLPPPPMPMYPMVPVPPMMSPPFPPYPFPVPHVHEDGNATTCSTSSTTVGDGNHSASTGTTADYTTTVANDPANEGDQEQNQADNENNNNKDETPNILRSAAARQRIGARQKLMKKLREKMKRKNKLENFLANEYQGLEPPILEEDILPNFIRNRDITPGLMPVKDDDTKRDELPPGLRDIDFKYLTQLIHKGNLNSTTANPSDINKQTSINADQAIQNRRSYFDNKNLNDRFLQIPKPIEPFNMVKPPATNIGNQLIAPNVFDQPVKIGYNEPGNAIFNRDINNQASDNSQNIYSQQVPNYPNINNRRQKRIEEANDTYYSNLGRQIASMIRNIETDREVDIEIEKSKGNLPNNPIFMENNYGSRSFWERSVRSPFQYIKTYRKEMDHLKQINENLFGLENEVASVTATKRTLSLQELENVISKIDKTKSQLVKNNGNRKPIKFSKTSFNVNLLPRNDNTHFNTVNKVRINKTPEYGPINFNTSGRRLNTEAMVQPEIRNILLDNFFSSMPDIGNNYSSSFKKNISHPPIKKPDKLPDFDTSNIKVNMNNAKLQSQDQQWILPRINYTTSRNSSKPILKNGYRYYNTNINHYMNQNDMLPIRYPTSNHYVRRGYGQQDKPSYFHYFDT